VLFDTGPICYLSSMQNGSLRKLHGAWILRYYVDEIGPDGQPRRRQISKKLARVSDDYRSKGDLRELIDNELAKVNRGSSAEASLRMSEFFDAYFLPAIRSRRRASTEKFYRDAFNNHLRSRIGEVRLRDFRTVDAQRVLDDIDLSHSSLQRTKTVMSAIFSHALRLGFVSGSNPVREARPEGRRSDFEGHAVTVEDIAQTLSKLTGVARAAVATAAFTGLRLAELRGLQWEDYDGSFLCVRRSVWRKNVSDTKTPESKASVPVIAALKKILDGHRRSSNGSTWIFEGERNGFSLNFDNLTGREIRPVLGDQWLGWHAFRRGLATVLFGVGVDPEVAAMILRHADSSTTRRHYIKLKSQREAAAAMKLFEAQIRHSSKRRSARKPRKH
jgi:integrase